MVLRPGRVPAPPDRLDADRRGALPARRSSSGRARRVAALGLRALGARDRGDALLRPRHRPDLRPPLAARRAAAPMRRAARRARRPARSSSRRPPGRTRRSRRESPGLPAGAARSRRATVHAPLRPVRAVPVDRGLQHRRPARSPAPAVAHGLNVVAPVRKLPTGDYTVRWHVLSADGHVVSGVWTFGVARARRCRRPRPTARAGRRAPSTSCAGSTSSRSRC